MNYKVTAEDALKQLMEQAEFPFTVMMKHGSMTIEYFAPQEVDTQTHISRMRSILSSQGIVPSIAMEKEFPVRKTMFCLFQQVWTITLKTFLMILQSGLFFMDPMVVRTDDR
jgi:hypothetical protein